MKNKFLSILSIALLLITSAFAQEITLLTPESGTPGQTLDVLVRGIGTHFQNNVSVASFGPDITVQKFAVSNSLTGTATIKIGAGASVGMRTVSVKTGSETAEASNAFEIFAGSGDFKVNIEVLPLEAISLSDLDLTHPASAPIMFFANVYNDNVSRQVKITIELSAASKGLIGKLNMPSRSLAPGAYLRLTNRDFTDVTITGKAGNDFLREVRNLGTFPPDNYTYKIVVTENGNVLANDDNTTTITNPIVNPELIMPGATFNMSLETVFTPFPLFQWFGQMDKYDLAIYEVLPGQTPEEAVRNITVYQKTDIAATNFLYPVSAEKLISGKVYAWQIKGKVNASGGKQAFPSEVFRFTYSGNDGVPNDGNVASIKITPEEIELNAGEQYQFNAVLMDGDNNIVSNAAPLWQVSPAKGTITNKGLFTAGNTAGTVAVIVKSGNINEFATITIKPKPANLGGDGDWMIDGMLRQLFGLPQ
jgi:hypothetical protein